ncbi:uncharacterized protein [Dermacentor albipictus]|uniref:uncharacterized protein n=1 Tax=Dermacentor albipictus TaxID=60249 RepID=UPI0038FCDC69
MTTSSTSSQTGKTTTLSGPWILNTPHTRRSFCGDAFEGVKDWLEQNNHVASVNEWDDHRKLRYIYFALKDSARIWFENHEGIESLTVGFAIVQSGTSDMPYGSKSDGNKSCCDNTASDCLRPYSDATTSLPSLPITIPPAAIHVTIASAPFCVAPAGKLASAADGVGAGSAGCVLANRLTADGTASVLLLEAGGLEDVAARVPFFSVILQGTDIDWDYTSERQHNASLSVDDQDFKLKDVVVAAEIFFPSGPFRLGYSYCKAQRTSAYSGTHSEPGNKASKTEAAAEACGDYADDVQYCDHRNTGPAMVSLRLPRAEEQHNKSPPNARAVPDATEWRPPLPSAVVVLVIGSASSDKLPGRHHKTTFTAGCLLPEAITPPGEHSSTSAEVTMLSDSIPKSDYERPWDLPRIQRSNGDSPPQVRDYRPLPALQSPAQHMPVVLHSVPRSTLQLSKAAAHWAASPAINRIPRGKVLGGSSSINHMIYARGNRKDFDAWASEYGADGWSYDDVLPDFISIETSHLGIDNGYHGESGEVPITFPSSHTTASNLFLEAGRELGYSNDDYNGPNQTSFSRVQNNIKNGERWSSSRSFIPNDVRRRKNFDVALYSHVTKVLFEDATAVGVEYKRNLGTHSVRAKKEVILCAGAIASPQLLMLSGIGPREHLESLGINVIADLPVGENLFDHITVNGIAATSVENIEVNYYLPSTIPLYSLFRTGPLIHAFGVEGVAFLSTPNVDPTHPNIQFLFVTLNPTTLEAGYIAGLIGISQIYENYYRQKQGENVLMIVPILLRPISSGYIRLKSTDPEEYPIIDPRFLTNITDLDELVEGAKIAVQTLETQAMKNGKVTIWDAVLPACESAGPLWSDSYLRCFVQHTSLSGWHPCCTAPMGTHPQAVLDARLRVLGGVKNLRVVDASSMPSLTAGNLNAPLMMMGHRAAAMIIEDNSVQE